MKTELAKRSEPLPETAGRVIDVMETLKAIRTFIGRELREGIDYGVIPNTGDKPALFQPGAQKVLMYFNCYASFRIKRIEFGEGHVEFLVKATVRSRSDRSIIGEGVGSCSTMESKYRWRSARRVCPSCGKDTIIQTKKGRNAGGYWCIPDRGGCGADFRPGDPAVEGQVLGRIENPCIHDTRNTVLKIAKKRALVDGAMSLSCVSDHFTQDVEDMYDITPQAPEPQQGIAPVVPPSQPAPPAPEPPQVKPEPPKPSTNGHTRPNWRKAVEYGVDRNIERYPLDASEPRKARVDWLTDNLILYLKGKGLLRTDLFADEIPDELQRLIEKAASKFQATIYELAKQRPEAWEPV